ncbi:MAG: transaldolase [Candidatus Melainabacteria bacterium]|nr:transaldolase [Candidatus Melainabacteria bacterium]MBI3308974.1 transaldolase [Candidatus Melainabacteria bacterium]
MPTVETQLLKSVTPINKLKVKIFADGADLNAMIEAKKDGVVKGFTTNPTLMKKNGIKDYEAFAKEVLKHITDTPISFEVFSDDFDDMERQAKLIASWGKNVNVKIPITNTKRESSISLVKKLSGEGLSLNITAILTLEQVKAVSEVLNPNVFSIVSVFAGRIADTGRDPVPYMLEAANILKPIKNANLLWASSRELLNIYQAEATGCHIITVTYDILKKLKNVNKGLADLSLDTVQMFHKDASESGFRL